MPQNPILKAHLEGVENYEKLTMADGYYKAPSKPEALAFLTTYAESILNAAKEAGPEKSKLPKKLPDPFHPGEKFTMHANINYNEGFNDCLSSFRQAIDEGIKEIKKGNV